MSRSIIFVLGSGFSKSFCPDMPVMADFKDIPIDNKYENLYKFVEKHKVLNKLSDIETLATVILSKSWFYDFHEKIENLTLRHELLSLIRDKISEKQDISPENLKIMKEFIYKLRQKEGELLSFNYDLIIEKTDECFFYPCIQPYDCKVGELSDPLSDLPLEYLKLHGSLDWHLLKGAESVDISSVRQVSSDSDEGYIKIHKDDVPVFIPMAHTKESFLKGTLFSTLWSRAICHLKEAQEIHFIGYGFPETDINNTVIFLKFKEKIKSIVILADSTSKCNSFLVI